MTSKKQIVLDWYKNGLISLSVGAHGLIFAQGIGDGSFKKAYSSYDDIYNQFKNKL